MKALVSIIVPVYNCEKYLPDCLKSICNQSYKDIEVIVVNDGSTDSSGSICEGFLADERVKYFPKKNEGVSVARNYGISKARGDYITFVDADDWIEKGMIEHLVRTLEHNKADVAMCGLFHDYSDHSRAFPEKRIKLNADATRAIKEVLINYIAIAGPVCKLFKHELLRENIFPKNLHVGEDAVCVVDALKWAELVAFDTKPFYHYNHRDNSAMTSEYSSTIMDLIDAYKRIEIMLEGKLAKEVFFRQIWSHFYVLDKMLFSKNVDKDEKALVVSWIRMNFFAIIKNPYVGFKRKISLIALMLNKSLYKQFVKRK